MADEQVDAASAARDDRRSAFTLAIGLFAFCILTVTNTSDEDIVLNAVVSLPILGLSVPMQAFFGVAGLLMLVLFGHYCTSALVWVEREPPEKKTAGLKCLPGWLHGERSLVPWALFPVLYALFALYALKTQSVVLICLLMAAQLFCALGAAYGLWVASRSQRFTNRERRMYRGVLGGGCMVILGILLIAQGKYAITLARLPAPLVPRDRCQGCDQCFPGAGTDAPRWSPRDKALSCDQCTACVRFLAPTYPENCDATIVASSVPTGPLGSLLGYFDRANLAGRRLSGHEESGKTAYLEGASLWRADLAGVGLVGAKLESSQLSNANLIGADLRNASLRRASLVGANLEGADLREADLSEADLRCANLSRAHLKGANLAGALLGWASLRFVDATAAVFDDAVLTHADIEHATLKHGSFIRARMCEAELGYADLSEADLGLANLREVKTHGIDLGDASLRLSYAEGSDLSLEAFAHSRTAFGVISGMIRATPNESPELDLRFTCDTDPLMRTQVQLLLESERFYHGPLDAIIGKVTTDAIRRFQTTYLTIDPLETGKISTPLRQWAALSYPRLCHERNSKELGSNDTARCSIHPAETKSNGTEAANAARRTAWDGSGHIATPFGGFIECLRESAWPRPAYSCEPPCESVLMDREALLRRRLEKEQLDFANVSTEFKDLGLYSSCAVIQTRNVAPEPSPSRCASSDDGVPVDVERAARSGHFYAAVMRFQALQGLDVDGEIGPETGKALRRLFEDRDGTCDHYPSSPYYSRACMKERIAEAKRLVGHGTPTGDAEFWCRLRAYQGASEQCYPPDGLLHRNWPLPKVRQTIVPIETKKVAPAKVDMVANLPPKIGVNGSAKDPSLNEEVAKQLRAAGAEPVRLPLGPLPDLAAYDGLVLIGGEDVDPKRYGKKPHPTNTRENPQREQFDFDLLQSTLDKRIPILAICLGAQELWVHLGGALIQDIPTEAPSGVNHRAKKQGHLVNLQAGSRLARIYGAKALTVYSNHHQGFANTKTHPRGLAVTAHSSDGLIEAFETTDANRFVVGVGWHPERSAAEQVLFAEFVRAARSFDIQPPKQSH